MRKTFLEKCINLRLCRVALVLLFLVPAISSLQANPSQNKTISGVVTSATDSEPLIGVSVQVRETATGGITDIDGRYSVSAQQGQTLVFSYIGYQSQEIKVGTSSVINVVLKEDTEMLDEVVVVGYGVQKKKLVTGATVQVKGDEIAKMNTTNPLQAMQGQTPGVSIASTSGQPGADMKVSIRGLGTVGNSAPLYLIDGVGGDISTLNPADIERIDVLKDAASCAIYGSSGANGVILITTKQGKVGKVSVSYDGNIGWANIYKMPDMLNAKEYMAVMDQVAYNNGGQPYDWSKFVDADLLTAYQNGTNPGTDWVKEFRNKNAVVTNHALNVTGGSEFSKFSTGIGYQYQDGAFGGPVKTDYRRFTFRINSEHVIYRKGDVDVIKFGENIYYQHKQNQGVQLGNQYSNDLSNALRAIPLIPVYNENGDFFMYDDLKNFGTSANGILDYTAYASNPMAHMVYNQAGNNKNKNFNLNTAAYLEVQPLKNLIYKGQVSYKQWSSSWRSYLPVYQINNQGDSRDKDQTINNVSLGWNWSLTNTLSYRFDITDLHHFDVLAGTEYSKSRPTYGESVEATGYNSAFGDFTHAYLHNTERKATATVNGYPSDYGSKMSYFGRLNYDFKETYMFSAIIRADGSSKFAKGNQWGYFPSFSAGWVISNEAFMKNTASWLGFLKVRAGWGQNGNDNIPNSNWRAGYEFGDYGLYTFGSDKNGGTTGAYPNRLANPDLTWETSKKFDIGFDLSLINRIHLTFDYYNEETSDALFEVPLSMTTGMSTVYQNIGAIRNRGIEASINASVINNNNLTWNIYANMTWNKNKIIKLSTDEPIEYTYQIIEEGRPYRQFYMKEYAGVDRENGKPLWYLNEEGNETTSDYNAAAKRYVGDADPKVLGGFGTNLSWKGFDFNMNFTYRLGGKVFDSGASFTGFGMANRTPLKDVALNSWTEENKDAKYPQYIYGDPNKATQTSSRFLYSSNFLRISNMTLGYTVPVNLTKKIFIQKLRAYISIDNLYTFTSNDFVGYNPETYSNGVIAWQYPATRTFIGGIQLSF